MQEHAIEIEAQQAKEKLANAISRLENAISAQKKRISTEEKKRHQVIKELDAHIANLEILINPNKK